ncbi:hypothetical protein PUR49_08185 [Streptomyces sp. BE147]|uniref:hypothetical protein n=1 Tax=Streptomyces sp. BE147 TaxID=3002524 RepID=UPI002E771370|nr:hypothetical protein [Streptomyces sp. BE147]MEE1736477.1 hypothetical protein [Streptomyces sp. BE147]
MPCIACGIAGRDGRASGVVTAASGLGLGSCADHAEVTGRVLRTLRSYEQAGLHAPFASVVLTAEPQHDRATGEGVVYGRLPGSGGPGRSRSVGDVLFGRTPPLIPGRAPGFPPEAPLQMPGRGGEPPLLRPGTRATPVRPRAPGRTAPRSSHPH